MDPIIRQINDLVDNLPNFTVLVSELVSADILDTDVFIVDRQFEDSTYREIKLVDYKSIKGYISADIANTETTMYGYWKFGYKPQDGYDNKLLINTSTVYECAEPGTGGKKYKDGNCAVNVEYFDKKILRKITDLSNYIYGTNKHVHSSQNEVIYSYTASSDTYLKNIFGIATTWKSIDNYILGFGKNEANNTDKYGGMKAHAINVDYDSDMDGVKNAGAEFVTLDSSGGFPSHNHPFSAQSQSFSMAWRYGTGMVLDEVFSSDLSKSKEKVYYKWSQAEKKYHRPVGSGQKEASKGNKAECTVSLYGERSYTTKSFTSSSWNSPKIHDTIYTPEGEKVSLTSGHNNIPPTIVLYCWKRTS